MQLEIMSADEAIGGDKWDFGLTAGPRAEPKLKPGACDLSTSNFHCLQTWQYKQRRIYVAITS